MQLDAVGKQCYTEKLQLLGLTGDSYVAPRDASRNVASSRFPRQMRLFDPLTKSIYKRSVESL